MEANEEKVNVARPRELIKNKRLISWAYIWRFFVLLIITCLVCFSISFFISNVIKPSFFSYDVNVGNIIMSDLKEGVLFYLSGAIVFIVSQIIGWKIIHKSISKKVYLEKQNVSYVKKSVLGIVTIAFAFCLCENIIGAHFIDNMNNISNINNMSNMNKNINNMNKNMSNMNNIGNMNNMSNMNNIGNMNNMSNMQNDEKINQNFEYQMNMNKNNNQRDDNSSDEFGNDY